MQIARRGLVIGIEATPPWSAGVPMPELGATAWAADIWKERLGSVGRVVARKQVMANPDAEGCPPIVQ